MPAARINFKTLFFDLQLPLHFAYQEANSGVNSLKSADLAAHEVDVLSNISLNLLASQLLKAQPISLQLRGRYNADKLPGGPDWGLRANITFLFPK